MSCLLLLVSSPINGQLDSAAKVDVIKRLSLFRSELLKDTNSVIAYGVVVHENSKLNWDKLNYRRTFYINEDLDFNFKELNRRNLEEKYGEKSILTQMNIDVGNVYYENRYLASANYFGLVENAYPFNIRKDLSLFKELEFYDIHSYDSICDYNIGFKCFSPLLCCIYPNLKINLFVPFLKVNTECKENYFIKKFNSFKDSSSIEFVEIEIRKNQTPALTYDKVFMNFPIGYAENPSKQLKVANKILKSDGYLFIAQYSVWMNNECVQPYVYSTEKLNNILSKTGFIIVDTLNLNSKTVYKCIKTKNI